MVIGVCRVNLAIPENASLKGKRSVVRRVISRVRATFNVAIAEVEDMDNWHTATLGFAVVSNDSRVANSVADKIIAFIQGLFLAEIEDYDFEIIHCWGRPMRSYKRSDRVASLVLQALSEAILLHVRDPRVQGVVVTHVKMTADMSIARVHVRSLTTDEASRRRTMAGLETVKGFLRTEIARRVKLLRVPQLEFFYDDIPDKAARVDEILRTLRIEE